MLEVFFNGTAGRIQAKYHKANSAINLPIAIVFHSHPMNGGNINQPVVKATCESFIEKGFNVLTINYRGIGRSEGVFDEGEGELMDAAKALDWMHNKHPSASKIWVCGFSFGALLAMQLVMRRPEIDEYIVISPPINKYDFSFLSPCPIEGLVVQGTLDSVITEAETIKYIDWIKQQQYSNINYSPIYNADHFYREKIEELKASIRDYISQRLEHALMYKPKMNL